MSDSVERAFSKLIRGYLSWKMTEESECRKIFGIPQPPGTVPLAVRNIRLGLRKDAPSAVKEDSKTEVVPVTDVDDMVSRMYVIPATQDAGTINWVPPIDESEPVCVFNMRRVASSSPDITATYTMSDSEEDAPLVWTNLLEALEQYRAQSRRTQEILKLEEDEDIL